MSFNMKFLDRCLALNALLLVSMIASIFYYGMKMNLINMNGILLKVNISETDHLPQEDFTTALFNASSADLDEQLFNASKKMHTIIIWYPPFGTKNSHPVNSLSCGHCEVTYDKSKAMDSNTKAIVFHFKELNLRTMPKTRRTDQLYVWWAMESPVSSRYYRGFQLKEFDNVFNLTMTHRRDSDVYEPYDTMPNILKSLQQSGSGNYSKDIDDLVSKKSKLAFWMVANCNVTPGAKLRLSYVNELVEAGLNVDRRGYCFSGMVSQDEVYKYKFYLSFENAVHCKDYITEKLFGNSFRRGAVPLVYGASKEDYQAVVPPGSVIYTEDFETPKQLVDYLHYLDKNETAYRKYFDWRKLKVEEMPAFQRKTSFCELCRITHGINIGNKFNANITRLSNIPTFGFPKQPRIVPSLRDWFYGTENRECLPTY